MACEPAGPKARRASSAYETAPVARLAEIRRSIVNADATAVMTVASTAGMRPRARNAYGRLSTPPPIMVLSRENTADPELTLRVSQSAAGWRYSSRAPFVAVYMSPGLMDRRSPAASATSTSPPECERTRLGPTPATKTESPARPPPQPQPAFGPVALAALPVDS